MSDGRGEIKQPGLNIAGIFGDAGELEKAVRLRKICYDSEPYYMPGKGGALIQIGFQLNLYATFPEGVTDASPDSPEYERVERDVQRIAAALTKTCNPYHMCGSSAIDSGAITYAHERGMRPDVTVHVRVFDQRRFGHAVDEEVINTFHMATRLLESAGVRKGRWQD